MSTHQYFFYQDKYEKKYGKEKTIVFMQIGSFHEAYMINDKGYDLYKLQDIMNTIVTRKNKNKELSDKNPNMLGFPSISKDKYIKILVDNGFTVVIVDQTTEPPEPKREVTGIFSPGTYISNNNTSDANNILSIYIEDEKQLDGSYLMCIGLTVIDLSTGENTIHEVYAINNDDKIALDEAVRFINSYKPTEILISRKKYDKNTTDNTKIMNNDKLILYLELENKNYHFNKLIDKNFFKLSYQQSFLNKIFPNTGMLNVFEFLDLEKKPYSIISYIILLDFAYQHNENIINNLYKPIIFNNNKHLILGNNAIFQLNVINNGNNDTYNNRFKSLFHVVNHTSTSIGKRFLKNTLIAPLTDSNELNSRYNAIQELLDNSNNSDSSDSSNSSNSDLIYNIEYYLKNTLDIERLHRKLSLNIIHPYEFAGLINSYYQIINVIKLTRHTDHLSKFLPNNNIIKNIITFYKKSLSIFDLNELKNHSLHDITKSFFKTGFNSDIDQLQYDIDQSIDFIENICSVLSLYIDDIGKAKQFKKHSDDKSKIYIKKNDRDGYYLSITKIRADTLLKNIKKEGSIKITDKYSLSIDDLDIKHLPKGNSKIFFPKLKSISDNLVILSNKLSFTIKLAFLDLISSFYHDFSSSFHSLTTFVAHIDFLTSGAKTAKLYNYSKPSIITSHNDVSFNNSYIKCTQLRHPIVERINTDTEYIPHDISLGNSHDLDDYINGMLIYGLNSCGKSTIMKSIGLNIILAQSGLFVPATSFVFAPYFSLYARITGNDNLFKGMSSFALEMTELKSILSRSGPNTLVIGDEVCRGTEYLSANSIVAATLVNLANSCSSFIFATHLHELPLIPHIKNLKHFKTFHLTVSYDKSSDSLIFDRLLKPGPGNSFYGITVARYIINDHKFISLAQDIKNNILNVPNHVLSSKSSKYNSNIYIHKCDLCHSLINPNDPSFDTHHIHHQKDCKNGFVIDKPHLPKNSSANLSILCKSCHRKVHNDPSFDIIGYINTSNGRKLQFNSS